MECSKREMYRDMARATKWDELRSGVTAEGGCYRRPKTSLRSSPAMPQTALQWRVEPPRLGASP